MNKPEWMLTPYELAELVVAFIAENESKPIQLLSQDINKILPHKIAEAQAKKLLDYLIEMSWAEFSTKELKAMKAQLEAHNAA